MKDKTHLGCIFAIVRILICTPMYYALLWGVLSASEAPEWCWVIYWIFIPVNVSFAIGGEIVKSAIED